MPDTASEPKALVGGSGDETPKRGTSGNVARQRRASTGGSTQTPLYGRAGLKVYPINEDQLAQLGTLKGLSGLCFTLAGAAFGFAINIYKDLNIQGQIPKEVLAYWSAVRDFSFGAAIILALVGVGLFLFGHHRLSQIKKKTTFDD